MRTLLRAEEALMAFLSLYLLSFYSMGIPAWGWALLFFGPDISMLGYLWNTKVGAVTYNIVHHKGVAIILGLTGYWLGRDALVATGLILFAHSSLDRVLGYGLKYFTDFKDTHLGKLPAGKH